MNTLIEIHALQNFAPSNLNRDDTGAPKDALFGGTRRARISSQCLKKAIRSYFAVKKEEQFFSSDELAIRTKRVRDALTDTLMEKKRPKADAAEKSRLALEAMELSVKEDGKSQYLMFLGQREIAGLANIIHEGWDSTMPPNRLKTEARRPRNPKSRPPRGRIQS